MDEQFLAFGLVWYVVFLFSTTCHEAAHALAAKLGGDLTAFHGGQVTLDPIPHIRREPFGMVLFPLLSYLSNGWMMGWASAPYDPLWANRHPHRAAWMALAGPAANFTLALLAGIAVHIGIWAGVFVYPHPDRLTKIVTAASAGPFEGAAVFLSMMFFLNVLLGTFNLLPIPPLDGFSVIGLFASEDGARKLEEIGGNLRTFSFVGMLIGWQIFDVIGEPIFDLAMRVLYPF